MIENRYILDINIYLIHGKHYYHYYISSILDIEHSPNYIALGSTHNHIVIY